MRIKNHLLNFIFLFVLIVGTHFLLSWIFFFLLPDFNYPAGIGVASGLLPVMIIFYYLLFIFFRKISLAITILGAVGYYIIILKSRFDFGVILFFVVTLLCFYAFSVFKKKFDFLNEAK